MEQDILELIKEIGLSGCIGVILMGILKHYIMSIIKQNNDYIDYLMAVNRQLIETNQKISDENRKALAEHGRLIQMLIDELRMKR